MVDDGVVVYAAPPLSPLEGRRLLGVLPYTPEEVAVPADAAGDASSVLVCSSATAPFCSSDVAFGAYGIEIGRPPRPDMPPSWMSHVS